MAESISEYTGEPYDPSWGTQIRKGKKLPLRKCLQCHTMKREDFHDRCHACYEANDLDCQLQVAAGERFPLDRNLIGWVYATSQPGLHDYLWYFLKWLFRPKAVIVADRPYRFANDGTPIYGYQPIGRYMPATDTGEPAPYVKDEHEADSTTTDFMLYY